MVTVERENPVHELPRLVLVDLLHVGQHAHLAHFPLPVAVLAIVAGASEDNLGQAVLCTLLVSVLQGDFLPRGRKRQQVIRLALDRLDPVAQVTSFGCGQFIQLCGGGLCGQRRLTDQEHRQGREQAAASMSDTHCGTSRSSRRRTFPIGDFGRASRNSTWRGTLYAVSCNRQCSTTASFVSCKSLRTMTTFTASPDLSSRTPTTPHSSTPWCIATTLSISFGKTLNPDTTIMSFLRSVIVTYPSAFILPTSPVFNQPSRITLAVSAGLFQ